MKSDTLMRWRSRVVILSLVMALPAFTSTHAADRSRMSVCEGGAKAANFSPSTACFGKYRVTTSSRENHTCTLTLSGEPKGGDLTAAIYTAQLHLVMAGCTKKGWRFVTMSNLDPTKHAGLSRAALLKSSSLILNDDLSMSYTFVFEDVR